VGLTWNILTDNWRLSDGHFGVALVAMHWPVHQPVLARGVVAVVESLFDPIAVTMIGSACWARNPK